MKIILIGWYWFLLVSISRLLTGCAHVYYSPNAQNVPLFKEKGEKILSVATGGGVDVVDFGLDVQTAYALTNNLGVMGNYYHASGKSGGDYKEGGQGHLLEVGLGYFAPLQNKGFSFELFGGTGKGKVYNYYDEFKESTSKLNYNRHFAQAALGWKNDFCKIALSNRFGILTYNKIEAKDANIVTYPAYLDGVTRNTNYFLIEPAFTTQIGYRALKAQFQFVYSINQAEPQFNQENVNVNLGLYVTLPSRKKTFK